ncbi:MAG: PstS family phosphate ABC transporter substrate-binding protein [Puniceicoccaceae bacterium]
MKIHRHHCRAAVLTLLGFLALTGCKAYRTSTGQPTVGKAEVTSDQTTIPQAQSFADSSRESYEPTRLITGRLRSIGSDTMDVLVAEWEKKFKTYHPSIAVTHEGRGTSTAIPGLTEGRSDFGPMSRSTRPAEIEKFVARHGYEPVLLATAIDALAVYVHRDNPIADRGLTLAEVDAIFSSDRRRGAPQDIVTWDQLGLTGEWANAPITVYSRNKASGTYGFFQENALKKGEFKTSNIELPGSARVVEAVSNDKFGIGFSGFGYMTDGVRAAPLAIEAGLKPIPADETNAVSGLYPLARFLYLAVNKEPGKPSSPLQQEFFKFIFSAEGQQVVTNNGFFAVSPKTANEELSKLDL